MAVGETVRREVRLDREANAALEEELQRRHLTFAAWLREKLEQDREQRELEKRHAAVERLASMNIDLGVDPDDPDAFEKLMEELFSEEDAEYDDAFLA
jgi:16S rRNA C967 or C1407 C5-methylase (RsmB/RsmF family)